MPTRPIAPSVNVTAESGATVANPLTNWLTTVERSLTEHLAGTTRSAELIHFYWERRIGTWRAENLTEITGSQATGSLTAWVTPDGPYTVEHIAACDMRDHLLVFYRSTRDHIWKVVDVTAKTRREVVGGLSSWQTPSGTLNVEHVSGRDRHGNLFVFWWSPANDWQAVSVTEKTGVHIDSDVTNWQVRRRDVLTEYLAASDPNRGRVVVFSWTPATDWQAQVTEHRAVDGVSAWVTDENVEHLSGIRADGTVYVLWRRNTLSWNVVDITQITSQLAHHTSPAPYQLRDGNEMVELLGAVGPDGHALLHWWKPSRDWQALDLTDLTGHRINTKPAVWITSAGGGRLSEHLAAVDTAGNVRVFYSYDQPRVWTDHIGNPYRGVTRRRNLRRRVITILWDPHYPGIPQPDKASVTAQLASMRQYFVENSGGTFQLQDMGTLGWYDADQPLEYYDNESDPHDKAGAAIRAAAEDFDFTAFDDDGDGVLKPDELAIVFAHPGGPGGLVRTGSREVRDLDGSPLIINGVRIRECVEVGIGHPSPNFSVVAHELCHLLCGLPDMYFTFFTPTAAGLYSIMDSTYSQTHIDGFNKMKLGWAHPRLVLRSLMTLIPDVETRRRVLILIDPDRSLSEYFLVENRWRGTSFDANLPDQGLVVWHIMENDDDYNTAPPPPTVDMDKWNMLGSDNWGRKAIRMIRPVLQPPFNDARALWDASEGDLLSSVTDLSQPALRWADGTPSGFSIRAISLPGGDVSAYIEVS